MSGHTSALLRRLASEVENASVKGDEEGVHDLRVSIRRVRECLRTFKELYPAGPRKKVRKQLRKLMKAAELARSADIALGLLKKAGLKSQAPLVLELVKQRDEHRAALRKELAEFSRRPQISAWSEALGL
jgi:CHAD domain-containing protein